MGLLDQMAAVFNFLKNRQTVFHIGYTNLYSYQQCTRDPLLVTPSPTPAIFFCLFANSYPNKCEVIFHCAFEFPWFLISWAPFIYLPIYIIFLGKKCLLRSFAHVLIRLFFAIELYDSHIFWILTHYHMYALQIFPTMP